MGLAEDLAAAAARPAGNRCRVAAALDELDDDDREALAAALANPALVSTVIVRVTRANGIELSERSVQRHRRGACLCH